jgi:hypothetical protein
MWFIYLQDKVSNSPSVTGTSSAADVATILFILSLILPNELFCSPFSPSEFPIQNDFSKIPPRSRSLITLKMNLADLR